MKPGMFILFLFISTLSKSQTDSSLLSSFLKTNHSIFNSKENIPESFFKEYKRAAKKNFVIVDSGGLFNPTDVIYNEIANKQLIFGGIDSTKKTGFILYQEGGMVITSHLLLFNISSKRKPKFLGIYLDKKPQNYNELKSMVDDISRTFSKA